MYLINIIFTIKMAVAAHHKYAHCMKMHRENAIDFVRNATYIAPFGWFAKLIQSAATDNHRNQHLFAGLIFALLAGIHEFFESIFYCFRLLIDYAAIAHNVLHILCGLCLVLALLQQPGIEYIVEVGILQCGQIVGGHTMRRLVFVRDEMPKHGRLGEPFEKETDRLRLMRFDELFFLQIK